MVSIVVPYLSRDQDTSILQLFSPMEEERIRNTTWDKETV